MTIARKFLRWSVLVICIVWGLLQLNGALYAAWAAGGPPTPNPDGWLFVAGNRLAWSFASFFGGIGLFLLLRHVRLPSKASILALVAAVLLTAFPFVREFIASDSCLDSGGQWSRAELRCLSG